MGYFRKLLKFDLNEDSITQQATIDQVLNLYNHSVGIVEAEARRLRQFLANSNIKVTNNLQTENGEWKGIN